VEVAAIERLRQLRLMRQWFHRLRNRTNVAGPWIAAELRAVRLGVGSVWKGQGRSSNSDSSAERLRRYREARSAEARAMWGARLLEGRDRYGPGYLSRAVLQLAWRLNALVWRRRARVFGWAEGIGEFSIRCVASARHKALSAPAELAWNEATRAAKALGIAVDMADLERCIRAGVVCWRMLSRLECGVGSRYSSNSNSSCLDGISVSGCSSSSGSCRCAWSRAFACRRRSVEVAAAVLARSEVAAATKTKAAWALEREEGRAAMSTFLATAGPRVSEQQW
jgi:hypothetical protein